jgi:hypothetical protein
LCKRKYGSKVVVGIVPMVVVVTKRERGIEELLEQEKKHSWSQYNCFIGIGRGIDKLPEMLSGSRSVLLWISVLVHGGPFLSSATQILQLISIFFLVLVNWILCGLLLCQEFLAITHIIYIWLWNACAWSSCAFFAAENWVYMPPREVRLCVLAFRGSNIICVRIKACLFMFPYYERAVLYLPFG